MHILKIIHGYPPNYNAGSEVYSQSICNELSKSHQVSVFTREENPYAVDFSIRHHQEHDQLDFYFVNNPQGKDGYRHEQMDTAFAQLVKKIKPDITHIGHLNHLSTGLVDELNQLKIPIVFTLHDFWLMCPRGQFLTRSIGKPQNFKLCDGQDDQKCASTCYQVYFSGREQHAVSDHHSWSNWVKQRMEETKAIIQKVDLFIAPSHYLKNRFIHDFGVSQDKITYLDYGFPTHYLTSPAQAVHQKPFTFGYIGTHIPAKGVNLLIEAFKQLKQPAKLIIFGRAKGQSTHALKLMAQDSLNPIEFAGEYINEEISDEVFAKIDCIVVPSIWGENSPLVIHEAQACKIPVITADFGGMKEYVNHQVNGLLFKHRDVASLVEQLAFALQHPSKMQEFGKRGYLYTQDGQVPSIQEHCQKLEAIYKRFIPSQKLWRITLDTNPEDCNLSCIMCEEHSPYSDFIPRLYQETGVKRRRMKFETVTQIFEEAAKLGVKEIIPSTMGEPLLYKGFEGIFELSQKHSIKINLTTNGTFPKRSVADWAKLIVPNTTDIKISWNGASATTSAKVMQGLNFDKTLENLKTFIDYRDTYHVQTGYYCRVTLQLTFMQNNMHELADIIKLAAKVGVDRVKGHHLWAHFDEIKDLSMKANAKGIVDWNRYVAQAIEVQQTHLKPNGEQVILENIIPLQAQELKEVPENYECPFLEKELWISATGKISPCCAPDELRQALGDFGNINTTTIQEVLKSDTYQHLVHHYKKIPLCKSCNMRKPSGS
ncbi:MAG: glycosyltransferase [Flammeovirgaceae bacterium]